jgi:hypothetical protein
MDREGFSLKDLSIDELTTEAKQLLSINLAELYAVLGFQLIGYSRPARLAAIVRHHATLKRIVDGQGVFSSLTAAYPIVDLSHGLDVAYEELKQDGIRFVDEVREELCNALCTPQSLELADRASAASIQIMVLMVTGALRMPPQLESLASTIVAIICKFGLKDFCQEHRLRTRPAEA